MATHTDSGGERTRSFSIGREKGEKTGRPVFLEWLREIPNDPTNRRKFETRGDATKRHYELFSALSGVLIDVYRDKRNILEKEKEFLYAKLDDGEEVYTVEIGDFDGRYSLNFMSRILHPNFNPQAQIRMSPYALEKDGKNYIGVSVYNPDKLETIRKENTPGLPEPNKQVFKGETLYDFVPVAEWLFVEITSKLLPKLPNNAWNVPTTPVTVPAPPAGPKAQAQTTRVPAAGDENFPGDDNGIPF